MNKKNIIFIIMLLLFFPLKVNAYNKYDCSYIEQARLRKLATNITTSYDYKEIGDSVTFTVTVTNMNSEMYIINPIDGKKYQYNGNNEFVIEGFSAGQSVGLKVYASKENCIESYLSVKYVNFPYYNKYYKDPLCTGFEGYSICSKWQLVTADYNTFKKTIDDLKNKEEEKKEEEVITKKTILDYIVEFLLDYYIYICVGLIVTILPIIYIYNKKNKFDL